MVPLKGFRGIDTPMHAARFVSLIPYKVRERPGGDRISMFKRHHTFLSEVLIFILNKGIRRY